MPTSKIDRLNKLFEDGKRLAKPDPDKPHIADLDFLPKPSLQKQAVTQYPEKVNPQVPRLGQDVDLFATADNDGHTATSSGKLAVKKPPIKSPPRGKPRGGKRQGQPEGRTHLTTTASELPKHDIEGNTLTGHFCPLMLVAKFPYKYMVDTDDRVSKYFFAQNKFYQREWNM
jgi:hypothetical protein